MMYTAYIKSETFHLPIAHHTLVLDVKNRLYSSKDFSQHAIGKLYPINRINHDCIIVEKQNTNIFLLNFLLLIMHKQQHSIEAANYYSNTFIIEKLEELTGLNLRDSYDDLETQLVHFLQQQTPEATNVQKNEKDTRDTRKTRDTIHPISFTINWVKDTHNKLK